MEKEVIQHLQKELSIQLTEPVSIEKLKQFITARVNDLIQHDFTELTQLLYRIDVNETHLKKMLNEAGESEAADIIATLIVERQMQKYESRKAYRQDDNINENERW